MIECPNCKISFSPRHRICPRCTAYEASIEDRMDYLASTAEIALENGEAPADIESMLLEEGVPSLVAWEIVYTRAQKVKHAARSYGLFRLLVGSGLFLLASMLVLTGTLVIPFPLGRRMVVAGLLIAGVASWPIILGAYSVLTGREKS